MSLATKKTKISKFFQNTSHLKQVTYPIGDVAVLKAKMLNWLRRFNIFCFLDSCHYSVHPHRFDLLVGAGAVQTISATDFKELDAFISTDQWKFGHLSYQLKKSLHKVAGKEKDNLGFEDYFFFVPKVVLIVKDGELTIQATKPEHIFLEIDQVSVSDHASPFSVSLKSRVSRSEYIKTIHQLKQHILRGDCYEINYCMEFFNENAVIDPYAVYQNLTTLSPNPFSAFYRNGDKSLLCASPERFLYKQAGKLVSQPIKGTINRNRSDRAEDEKLKQQLRQSSKDQVENVMVVDLVRNDLSRICKNGSVNVDELFGIYSYPQVHQMISTISGELEENVLFSDLLRALFPMGSMTGAPKHRVMQLIDEYEKSTRSIFSGSVGYIAPGGDFDFNVVIRSIMYHAVNRYLSYQVGSGITYYSDAEKEWDECLLKGEAIKKVLSGNSTF